jgi:phosphatidylserine/phosphatidylglycerophosphate/cardiolipin synthase-like enzyme
MTGRLRRRYILTSIAMDEAPMSQFDIASFADFRPPGYLCPRCVAVWQASDQLDWPDEWEYDYTATPEAWTCSSCSLRFEVTSEFSDIGPYLKRWGCVLEFGDLTERLRVLASAASELRRLHGWTQARGRSIRNLLSALNQARHFVHFVSTGLSWDFIGMLALLSHRVAVRGIVSDIDEAKAQQLLQAQDFGGRYFEVVPMRSTDYLERPHQKVIVIDGLLAITGSPNFTIKAWLKRDSGNEHAVIETRPEEVWKLNNSLFARAWQTLHPVRGCAHASSGPEMG